MIRLMARYSHIIDQLPPIAENVPTWLESLDDYRLNRVWVASVLSIIAEDYPDADLGAVARSLNVVRRRYIIKQ